MRKFLRWTLLALLVAGVLPVSVYAARTSVDWVNLSGTSYIQPNFGTAGLDLLILGANRYENFNTITGASGYGFRDNGGTMQWKNSGGSWANIGSGGGGSPGGSDTQLQFNSAGTAFGGAAINYTVDGSNSKLQGTFPRGLEMYGADDGSYFGASILANPGDSGGTQGGNLISGGGSIDNNTAGNGGTVEFDAGHAGAGTGVGDGGNMNFSAGNGGGASGAGGNLNLFAGTAQGTDSNGGNVVITSGGYTGAGTHAHISIFDSTLDSGFFVDDANNFGNFGPGLKSSGLYGIVFNTSNIASSNAVASFPNIGGTTDTFCFQTLANCASGGSGSGFSTTSALYFLSVNQGPAFSTSSATNFLNLNKDWKVVNGAYLVPTTTLGVIVSASSTIGSGATAGGLTISGGATTTGNAYFLSPVGINGVSNRGAFGGSGILTVNGDSSNGGVFEFFRPISSGDSNVFTFTFGDTSNSVLGQINGRTDVSGSTGQLIFKTSNGSADVTAMTINSRQQVMIGTTTAFGTLNVASSGPQVWLMDGTPGNTAWAERAIAGSLYFATSSNSSMATSTAAAISIDPNADITIKLKSALLATDSNGKLYAAATTTPANPTGSIGATSATNGSATTYMRSDAVPACTAATASVPGCLAAADWSTFNGKLNLSNLFNVQSSNGTSALSTSTVLLLSGLFEASTTVIVNGTSTNFEIANNASTTNLWISSLQGKLLGTDATGKVVATTSIGAQFLAASGVSAGSCTNCNLTITAQGIISVQSNGSAGAASSTLLTDNNTFAGINKFTTLSTTTMTSAFFVGTTTSGAGVNAPLMSLDAGARSSEEALMISGNTNNFFESNIKNASNGASAQGCWTETNDGGSLTTGFMAMCTNSSGFWSPQPYNVGGANDTSLMSLTSGDFYIDQATAGKALRFMVGGNSTTTLSGNEQFRMDGATTTSFRDFRVATTSGSAFAIADRYGTNVLNVNTASSTYGASLLELWSATSTGPLFAFDNQGHMSASSTAPVLSSCGTTPTISPDSSDFSGTITVGSVAATACTLSFGTPHTVATHCVISEQTGSVVNASSYTESLTGFTYSQTGLASDKLDYICTGK